VVYKKARDTFFICFFVVFLLKLKIKAQNYAGFSWNWLSFALYNIQRKPWTCGRTFGFKTFSDTFMIHDTWYIQNYKFTLLQVVFIITYWSSLNNSQIKILKNINQNKLPHRPSAQPTVMFQCYFMCVLFFGAFLQTLYCYVVLAHIKVSALSSHNIWKFTHTVARPLNIKFTLG
jgi:hypothetical protein